jgi:hypothetical protein
MTDKGKVYIVAEGSYSAYHIFAAFSSREKADAYILAHGMHNDPEVGVEVVDLDPVSLLAPPGMIGYAVRMAKDGEVLMVYALGFHAQELNAPRFHDYPSACLVVECWAKDEAQAIKIANEKRAEHIAMGTWVDDPGREGAMDIHR